MWRWIAAAAAVGPEVNRLAIINHAGKPLYMNVAQYLPKPLIARSNEWISPVIITVRDLARWSIALETGMPLSDAIKTAMWAPAKLNDGSLTDYGFGWQVGVKSGHPFMGHGGSWQGFNSFIVRYPQDRLAVIALANRAGARLPALVDRIVAHHLPDLAEPPPAPLSAKLLRSERLRLSGSVGDAPLDEPLRPHRTHLLAAGGE